MKPETALEREQIGEMPSRIPAECPLINGQANEEEFEDMPPRGSNEDERPIVIHAHFPPYPEPPHIEPPARVPGVIWGGPIVAWLTLAGALIGGVVYYSWSASAVTKDLMTRIQILETNNAEQKRAIAVYQAYVQQTRVDCSKAGVKLTPTNEITVPER